MEKEQREKRLRNYSYPLRLLDEELEILEIKAHEAGLSKADFLRNMILYGAAHKRTLLTEEYAEKIRYELNRIGNNINQIAYWANTLKGVDREMIDALVNDYNDLLGEFERVISE